MQPRTLLPLLLVVLALLGLTAVLFLRRPEAPPAAELSVEPSKAPLTEEAAAAPLESTAALAGADGARGAGRSQGVPVGVRLSGDGRLSGRVIDLESGMGVSGVRVDLLPVPPATANFFGRLLRMSSSMRSMAARVKPIAVAQSGAGGEFRFEGVRTGTWFVEARGPYHVPQSMVRARVLASGAGGPIEIGMFSGGRVLGTVYGPDQQPASRAQVMLVQGPGTVLSSMQSGDLRQLEGECDEQGRFVFEGIPPGLGYEITASGTSFTPSHALDISVRAGEDTRVDVRTRTGGSIKGVVFSGPGKSEAENGAGERKPLAGAHLGAVPRGLRNLRCTEEILERTHCVTAEDGSFTMEHVPPGEVDIVGIAFGHLPAIGARVAIADEAVSLAPEIELARGPVFRGRVVDAQGNPLSGVEVSWNLVDWRNFQFDFSFAPMMAEAVKGFELPKTDAEGRFWAGPVAGDAPWRATFRKLGFVETEYRYDPAKDGPPESSDITVTLSSGAAIEGIVIDELEGEPIPSFSITTSDRADTEADAPGARNPFSGGTPFEDEAGRFRIDSLKPGKVRLSFSAPGYPETAIDAIEVAAGTVKKGVIVKLRPGGTLKGLVVDPDGKPVVGAQVVALPADGKLENSPATRMREETRRRGRRGPFGGGDPFGAMGNTVPPGMTGFLANMGLLGDRAVLSRRDGSFELPGVDPGAVRVQAFHRDWAWGQSADLEVAEGKTVEGVQVRMHSGGGIEGKVTNRFGQPLEGSIVVAFSPAAFAGNGVSNAGGLYQGTTDKAGNYAIKHVSAGSYFVVVTRGDEDLNPLSFFGTLNFDLVNVPEDQIVRYDLVDTAAGGCRILGQVVDQGQPVTRGLVTAVRFDGSNMLGVEFKAARVDSYGNFEFAGLAPGDYQLNLDGAGPQVRMELEVPDAPELEIVLELPRGGIEGVVLDEMTREPIAGAEVTLRDTDAPEGQGLLGSLISRDGNAQRTRSDDKGRYSFARLHSSDYELSARGPRGGEGKKSFAPSAPRRIEVDERSVERGIDIALAPALVLRGTVKDKQGNLVPEASITVLQEGARGVMERGRADKDGRYEVTGLSPGKYRVSVSAKDHADTEKSGVELVRGKDTELDLVVEKGVLVRVRVVDASGRPVEGARAQLLGKDGQVASVSGAERALTGFFTGEGASSGDGMLTLGRYLPGAYTLEAQKGFARAPGEKVTVASGRDEQEFEIRLP
jgi:protocatechuate 3,4-dioxygenase beta subunit